MMTFFKVLWAFDALAALVILFFFFVGLADGTVSSRNAGLWMTIVMAVAAIIGGSIWLKRYGYAVPAYLLLCILALPALVFLGYLFIVLCNGKGAWR